MRRTRPVPNAGIVLRVATTAASTRLKAINLRVSQGRADAVGRVPDRTNRRRALATFEDGPIDVGVEPDVTRAHRVQVALVTLPLTSGPG